MKVTLLAKYLPWVAGLCGLLLLGGWLFSTPQTGPFKERIPGADRLGPIAAVKPIDLHGTLTAGKGTPSTLPGSWPRFRGTNLDGIATETLALPAAWPKAAPARLWRINVGDGYAGAAIHNGRVYLLDYDTQQRSDVLRCLSLADGAEIWSRCYPADVKRNHGMSRTVPAVTDHFVVTLGPKCTVLCADALTGEYHWGIDLVAEFHSKIPPWYAGQCPLIDGDRAIIAPGGDALMIAVDCATGKVVWKAANPKKWEMTHSSIMPLDCEGQRMYVYCASGGVVGIAADTGRILWQTPQWKVNMASVPSPVMVGSDHIFLSGGYGAGSMMVQLKKTGDQFAVEPVYKLPPEVFGSEQQTPIYYKGNIYGVIPGGQLVCLDPADGKPRWNSGSQHFGIGPYMITNDVILLINDTGTLSVVQAAPEKFHLLAQWPVLEQGHESWGPMALAGSRLLARDLHRLECLNLLEAGHD